MSKALRCDRCKKFYDPFDEGETVKRITYRGSDIYGMELVDHYKNKLATFDLCPECVKALDNFMNHPDKGESEVSADECKAEGQEV